MKKKFSADQYKSVYFRTLGTAEFSITRILKNITKYFVTITNPLNCLYEIQKALHICKEGRHGPVWVEVPLDMQSFEIKNRKQLKTYKPKKIYKTTWTKFN